MTCIRLHTAIDHAGFQRAARRPLPEDPTADAAPFPLSGRAPELGDSRLLHVLLDHLTYTYPTEELEDGLNAQERLEKLTWEGAAKRYPEDCPTTWPRSSVMSPIIERMEYAPYFLTVESIVCFARLKGILCQGRGSAANSGGLLRARRHLD